METFAASIKQKYQERLINREKQWPPCHSDKLVRLELVEREKGESYSAKQQRGKQDRYGGREDKAVKRTPLPYGDLFKVESGKRPVRKVLVEGDAGIGKTTLCIAVSEDWANGKLFQQFELVLHLPLRMKAVASAASLPQLLQLLHPCEDICVSVASYLKKTEGKSVLIIADGWDELSGSERQRDSFVYQLLFEIFSFISVMVTSRPSASASLHRLSRIDRFVEVQGFSKENIKEYINNEFTKNQRKATSLIEQLEYNPLVESVCSVPLNCAIVCHLWRTLEEALPTTMTQLYTKIILNVVLRNIQKNGTHENISSLSTFDALPADLQESWWLLCEFAYQTLERDQLVFSKEELANFFPDSLALSESIFNFGLLQSAESIFDVGYGASFHFLHLTFQEYLAALHLVKRLQSNQPIKYNIFESSYTKEGFSIVCRFFFGIYFNVLGFSDCVPVKPYLSFIESELVRCHCAFEARSADIENDVIKRGFIYCRPYTAHDCAAVLYVISKMQECQNVDILFGKCHVSENQIRALTNSLASKDGKVQIKYLDLSYNELSCNSLDDLLHRASSAFQSLRQLSLVGCMIDHENIVTMLAKPSCHQLTRLNLSYNSLGVSGLQALESTVNTGCLSKLQDLNLRGSLTDNADTNAAALATFLKSISVHASHLKWLDLSDNDLGVPGASALAAAISQHYTSASYDLESLWLTSILLNNTNLGDEGLRAFIELLDNHYHIDNLCLQNNGIHATGLKCLAAMILSDPLFYWMDCSGELDSYYDYVVNNCEVLDLPDNPIGIEGITAISEILSDCKQHSVDLSRCHLTTAIENVGNPPSHDDDDEHSSLFEEVGRKLCQMPKCFNVNYLLLDGNCFTGERIHVLAGFIHLCGVELVFLRTRDCNITSDDLIKLIKIIVQSKTICSQLLAWSLDDNEIDDRGVSALTCHIPSLFPSLGEDNEDYGVDLDGNPVSREMVVRLNEMLDPPTCVSAADEDGTQSSASDGYISTSSTETEPDGGAREEKQGKIDKGSTGRSSYERSDDPRALPWEYATVGASLPIIDETDTNRKRKSATEGNAQALPAQCIEQSQDKHVVQDFVPPPPKRQRQFTDDLQDVEHRFVELIKWEDENGVKRELRIYSKIAHKWRQIAMLLGFEQGEIESVEENHHRNYSRITAILGRWFENAINLSKASRYPKSWQGLINLLEDAELGEVAKELKRALTSPWNTVRDFLS